MKIVLSLTLSLLFSIVFAQGSGFRSEGREFYLGYLHPSFNDVAPDDAKPFYKVYALISSYEDNDVSISYFDLLTKKEEFPTTYKIKARQTTQILLDHDRLRMKEPGDIAGEFKSCHIVARRPISVKFFSTGAASGGSYLALPVHAWGKDYVVASYNDVSGYGTSGAGIFTIIAAYDATNVTIVPTARTGGDRIGVYQGAGSTNTPRPYTIGLNRGQCWMVRSKSASLGGNDDISGSIIKTDKPVAVISGQENGAVGDGYASGLYEQDLMIEQMVPSEFWSNTGIISIPFVDSWNSDPLKHQGIGDDQRIYVSDHSVPQQVIAFNSGSYQPRTYYPVELSNTLSPLYFYADSSKKFMVTQYDMRRQGTLPPYTAPSMITIVPTAQGRNSYQTYIPATKEKKFERHYVSIVASNTVFDGILVEKNGAAPKDLVTSLGVRVRNWSIQGMRAATFQLSMDTSYYFHSPTPFMAYHFGNSAVDVDAEDTLGDFSTSEHYFSYSLPLGMSLSDYLVKDRMSISVDTLCNGWRICATDSNANGGIRYVTLIDDKDRDLWPDASRQFSNVLILPPDEGHRNGEFHLANPPQSKCFTINADNSSISSSAPVAIYDKAGNYRILELSKPAKQISITPHPDSMPMFISKVGGELCKEITIINFPNNIESYTITKIELPPPTAFQVVSVSPPLPVTIDPDDTLRITICFTAPDTMLYRDTLNLMSDCLSMNVQLAGQAGTALILASDADFGTVLVGTKKCKDVEVRNVGNRDFTITSTISQGSEFTIDAVDLPLILAPGASHKFRICYEPTDQDTDSVRMNWGTDIPAPYDQDIKAFSALRGRGVMPGIYWDRVRQEFRADSTHPTVHRMNLINSSTFDLELTGLYIVGTDADEFSIVGIELPGSPPYIGVVVAPGDSMWVDVAFKIDLTKDPVTRHRNARIQTAAKVDSLSPKWVTLEAGFDLAKVARQAHTQHARIRPNPARDRITIDVDLARSATVSVALYTVLGSEMAARDFVGLGTGTVSLVMNLPKLPPGTYIARITIGNEVETHQIIIE